jgi:hypothetical protein
MDHLTGEQLESILWGGAEMPQHVDRCSQCRARLDEKYVLANQVRRVFSSVHAASGSAGQILAHIAAARPRATVTPA